MHKKLIYPVSFVLMLGLAGAAGAAEDPNDPDPADGAIVRDTFVGLSWMAGDRAASHNVYLGENLDDVAAGADETFRGNQASNSFAIGFPGFPYPEGAVAGTTYYWRI